MSCEITNTKAKDSYNIIVNGRYAGYIVYKDGKWRVGWFEGEPILFEGLAEATEYAASNYHNKPTLCMS